MIRTVVYQGDNLLGDVEVYPQPQQNNLISNPDLNGSKVAAVLDHLMRVKRIQVTHFTQPSERCSPLAVLYTIATGGVCLKMESNCYDDHTKPEFLDAMPPLSVLHSTCLRENKTAVVMLGEDELHLVAMRSRRNNTKTPCFWGFTAMSGLYDSCLVMLNLRCLGIVFDLDETLVVANTMRSFEDRIDSLQRKINIETDQQRIAGMVAEIKRYQDDRAVLKQYIESDQVIDNGQILKAQTEVVPALSDNHQSFVRPLIRLQNKNIVLTRINPMIRDTSVLVRMRPAWEELRSYLTARGRKRFEVYVCTMAERDYALEMWRLLDPDSNLINTNELLDRIVCVKSGSKKSLFNVFHDKSCHPKMALVVDDRLKVWDERDQPRVHVVPAFAPYYAPQAEANNAIPVLCVARNVACNVRGCFFKDFDDGLLQHISEVVYEDDLNSIPLPPDVSNYLVPEDETLGPNGNREPTCFDGMTGVEVERRLKEAITSSSIPSEIASLSANPDPRTAASQHYAVVGTAIPVTPPAQLGSTVPFPPNQPPQGGPLVKPLCHTGNADSSSQGSPAREEGEVPESELDPDTRRRLLILQHGQDTSNSAPNEPQFAVGPPAQSPIPGPGPASVSVPVHDISPSSPPPIPHVQSRGSWYADQMNPGQLGRSVAKEFSSDGFHVEKQHSLPPPFSGKMDNLFRSDRPYVQKQRFPREVSHRNDRLRTYKSFPGEDNSMSRTLTSDKDVENELGRSFSSNNDWDSDSGRSCSSHRDIEFESGRSTGSETAVAALHDIARKCGAKVEYRSALVASVELKFVMEVSLAGETIGEGRGRTRREAQHQAAEESLISLADKYLSHIKSERTPKRGGVKRMSSANDVPFSDPTVVVGYRDRDCGSKGTALDGKMKSFSSVSALKELCMEKGLDLDFKAEPPLSADLFRKDEAYAQVEIDGRTFSRGTGLTWDEARIQAAEKALESLNSMLGQSRQKRPGSPRSLQGAFSKNMKGEHSPRFPCSRYARSSSSGT